MTQPTQHTTVISNLGTEAHCLDCLWKYQPDDEAGGTLYLDVLAQARVHEMEDHASPEAGSPWVPVESTSTPDVLPAPGVLVWVAVLSIASTYSVTMGYRTFANRWLYIDGTPIGVTHWAPMVKPSPPAGAES